jgi:hypothetical protein
MRAMNLAQPSRRTGRLALAVAALLTAVVGLAGPAAALPPEGAGPDTAGTSSRVWPSEVKPGDKLYFEVSGYPANETVYIKIDDGEACTDTSHGACVYATQKLNGKGYAKGSIIVPELSAGGHWLRMLATGDQLDAKTGEKIGYLGYTRRGGNDFTVVIPAQEKTDAATETTKKKSSSASKTSKDSGTSKSADNASEQATTSADTGDQTNDATNGDGDTALGTTDADPEETAEGDDSAVGESDDDSGAGAEGSEIVQVGDATQTQTTAPIVVQAAPIDEELPVLGLSVFGATALFCACLLIWSARSRKASASQSPRARRAS